MLLRRNTVLLSAVLSVLLGAFFILSVKADVTMWTQTYGGPRNDRGSSLVETSNGDYVIAGTTQSVLFRQDDLWLIKTDAHGTMLWDQTYGGPEYDEVSSLTTTSDYGYAVAGYSGIDFWLVKIDAYGNMEWNKTYGGDWPDHAFAVVETSDGGYAVAGYTESFAVEDPDIIPLDSKPADFWLIKTDAYGNAEWNQTYGGKAAEGAYSLVATSDGGYALAGFTTNNGSIWLVKTDEFGNMEWDQTYGGGSFSSLVVTSDGGYAFAGSTSDFGAGESDFWLVKTDAEGNVEWNMTYGGAEDDIATSLVVTSDGGYALAGRTYSFFSDFWLVKTDVAGNMEWNQTYGGADWEYCNSLVATSDGGYALAGTTKSFGAGYSDVWVIKTDEYGVVPEAAWVVLPFLLVATISIFISKKKLLRKHSEER
jgi:hypothetical protein